MPKTIHRHEYGVLLRQLREQRKKAGLTQAECSAALGRHQSFISDIETGSRRLDIVQLRDLCRVLKIPLQQFVAQFERELSKRESKRSTTATVRK